MTGATARRYARADAYRRTRPGRRTGPALALAAVLTLFGVFGLAAADAAVSAQPALVRVSAEAAGRALARRASDAATMGALARLPSSEGRHTRGTGPPLPASGTRPPGSRTSAEGATGHATVRGIASTYGPGWDGWIAWPGGPGWRLRVCGPGGCVVVVTTDAGPDLAMQRAGRVVDLDVQTFEQVAGSAWTVGLTKVTLTVLGRTHDRSA